MRNWFTLAGVDSRDYGVYISGQGTFGAPAKAYELLSIPGRNGAIIGPEKRLENATVTYSCYIYSNFEKNIADFRTFLLSLDGYQTLTDSYHTDEFRLAVYQGPFDPEVTRKNDAGSFELVFSCKPQRFLTSGTATYAFVQGSPQSIKGSKVTAYGQKLNPAVLRMRNEWEDLSSGSPNHPSIIGYFNYVEMDINGTMAFQVAMPSSGTTLGVYADLITGQGQVTIKNNIAVPTSGWVFDRTDGMATVFKVPFTSITELYACTHFHWFAGVTSSAQLLDEMAMTVYESGCFFNGGYLYFAYMADQPETADATAFNAFISTLAPKIAGRLSTPDTFTFSPYTGGFPDGWIEISGWGGTRSDDYTFELEYVTDSDVMSNPTMFPSSPLITVNSTGAFTMDGVTVTISACDNYVTIDCETMDCYEGSTNRNKDVTFSTYDFPKLQPGGNRIEILSGITVLEIVPRWWRV